MFNVQVWCNAPSFSNAYLHDHVLGNRRRQNIPRSVDKTNIKTAGREVESEKWVGDSPKKYTKLRRQESHDQLLNKNIFFHFFIFYIIRPIKQKILYNCAHVYDWENQIEQTD